MSMKARYQEAYRLKAEAQKAAEKPTRKSRPRRKPVTSWTEWYARYPDRAEHT